MKKAIVLGIIAIIVVFLVWGANGQNYMSNQQQLPVAHNENDEDMYDVSELEHFNVDGNDLVRDAASVNQQDYGMSKMVTRNTAPAGTYKASSYAGRANDSTTNPTSGFDAMFDASNAVSQGENRTSDKFMSYDESENQASFQAGQNGSGKQNLSDIFNSDNYLPQEQNNDWFDMVPETVSVKNRNLINISHAIPASSINSSLRNATWDIRGDGIPNPKYVVSPWQQSTIEPDTNNKGFCT